MPDLLTRFPGLATLPRVDLGVRPTPLEERRIAGCPVLVKRDDLTSPVHGGNKTRPLEFILARPSKRVVTVSTLSAHHALATAVFARHLGREAAAVLVRRGRRGPAAEQLAAMGVPVREARTAFGAALALLRLWRPGTLLVPPGGMGARGAVGYLAAAFEFEPPPARIYLPLGTGTTAAGLLAGLALRGADTEVVAVDVVGSRFARPAALWRRAAGAVRWLQRFDPAVPPLSPGSVRLRVAPWGAPYGEPTEAALAALEAATPLPLDPTYSGPTLAVLLRERAAGAVFLLTSPA